MTHDDVLVWRDEFEWIPFWFNTIALTIAVTSAGVAFWLVGTRWAALAIWIFETIVILPTAWVGIQIYREGAR